MEKILVCSCLSITNREAFYLWLDKLPWRISLDEKRALADKAKGNDTAFWSQHAGFKFWKKEDPV